MSDAIPTRIGRFEIDRLLGTGAMGNVYLARDLELDRRVAIKTVKSDGMDAEAREKFLVRFKNEARAAGRLHHPSIVAVYDVGEDPEVGPYLVFEYVAGSTLKQIIRSRGALDAASVVRLADEVGRALDAAHAEGIIHRDIKPDNLLVTEDGRTKLADFGVARVPDAQLTREGQFLGTPCYAAPETLGQALYSRESDLFSLGAVLYEIVSGMRAFPGDDAIAVAHKVIHEEPPIASAASITAKVPPEVDAVLVRALAKDPRDRPGSGAELAAALRAAYVAAGMIEPTPDPSGAVQLPVATADRREKGRSAGIAFAAVLVGGLVLGIAIMASFHGQDPTEISDGGVGDALGGTGLALPLGLDAGARDARDAGPPRPPDAGPTPLLASNERDAGRGDAGQSQLSSFDREEQAKEALRRARSAVARHDLDAARRELQQARALDPTSDDLAEVERAIQQAAGG